MASLFFFLFFISFVCLILGLVKPSLFNRFVEKELSRKKIGLIFGIAMIVSFFLIGVYANPNDKIEKPVVQQTEQKTVSEISAEEGAEEILSENITPTQGEVSEKSSQPEEKIKTPVPAEQTENYSTIKESTIQATQETKTEEPSTTGKWYTSSHPTAKYYYHESCQGWQSLSLTYLKVFNSEIELLNKYRRTLHPDCAPK
jgi:hypothetical protein